MSIIMNKLKEIVFFFNFVFQEMLCTLNILDVISKTLVVAINEMKWNTTWNNNYF